MSDFTVIYDLIAWAEGDNPDRLVYRTALRGETVSSEQLSKDFFLGKDKVTNLQDVKVHPPFGAIAPADSKKASVLAAPVDATEDPARLRARLRDQLSEEHGLTDPAGRDVDVPSSTPGGGFTQAPAVTEDGSAEEGFSLDKAKKPELESMAETLGLDKSGKVEELRDRIREHLAEQPAGDSEQPSE